MTPSLDRAVEAGIAAYNEGNARDLGGLIENVILAALPHLSPGVDREALRTAVADYMRSEGCTCCQDVEAHEKHTETLAKLLNVEPYSDGSGYDFTTYRSK